MRQRRRQNGFGGGCSHRQKPSDAIQYVTPGTTADHPYPTLTKNYHYEIVLVAVLDKGGRNVGIEQALALVYGYTIGLDMTRRDLQRAMGDEKKPWEIGKSFDRSAPIGPIHPVARVGQAFELMPGDIIYSGTPENVGPVVVGDVMQGSIAGLPTLDVRVV